MNGPMDPNPAHEVELRAGPSKLPIAPAGHRVVPGGANRMAARRDINRDAK